MSDMRVSIPRDAEGVLLKIIEDIIKSQYGEAILCSLRSYISMRGNGKKFTELLLYDPIKLVDILTEFLGGSREDALRFIATLLKGAYDYLKETPELSVDKAVDNLRRGNSEDIIRIILELAYRIMVKSIRPIF